MRKNRLNNYVPNILISILLTFLVLIFFILCMARLLIASPQIYTNSMYKNGVDTIAYDEISDYFDMQYAYTGIKADVFKSAVTKEAVSASMFEYVDSTVQYLSGQTNKLPTFEFDYEPLEESIHNDFLKWCEENETEFDDELKENESMTIRDAKSVINTKLDVMMLSYLNGPNGISTKVHDNFGIIKLASIGISFVILLVIALLIIINRKRLRNIFYWCSTSVFSAGVLLIIPTAIIKASKYFDGLILKNDAVYNALTQSLYGVINIILISGIVMIVLAILLMFIYYAMLKDMFKFSHIKK